LAATLALAGAAFLLVDGLVVAAGLALVVDGFLLAPFASAGVERFEMGLGLRAFTGR
jgi:hypothetical protein